MIFGADYPIASRSDPYFGGFGGVNIQSFSGVAIGIGAASAPLSLTLSFQGSAIGIGDASAPLTRVRLFEGAAVGLGLALAGEFYLPRIVASDAFFYWDSTRGPVPTVGGRPYFSRASAAPTTDAAGRAFDALPNTPRFPWSRVSGAPWGLAGERLRPLLHLQQARTVGAETYAVDRAHWDGAFPGARGYGLYLCHLIEYDPAGSGHLLYLGATSGAAPHIRIRYSAGAYRVQLHNGSAAVEIGVPIGGGAGSLSEILVLFSSTLLEVIAANNGVMTGSASAALPAGGLPAAWSAEALVVNGYDSFPSSARYGLIKAVKREAFVTLGTDRLEEIRGYHLNASGDLLD